MTERELVIKAIGWLKDVVDDMQYLTTGNLAHKGCSIRGRARRAYEYLEKHLNDCSES